MGGAEASLHVNGDGIFGPERSATNGAFKHIGGITGSGPFTGSDERSEGIEGVMGGVGVCSERAVGLDLDLAGAVRA